MIRSHQIERCWSAGAPSIRVLVPIGTATSNDRPTSTPKKCGGVTPTMVKGTRSTVSERPMTSALPPNRRCQKPWLMTATGPSGPPPGWSSADSQGPAEEGRHTENVEHAAARPQAVDELAFTVQGQVETRARDCEGAVEQVRAIPDLLPDRVRPIRSSSLFIVEEDKPAGLGDGERAENERVENGKDGRIGADAKGQGQDRHG